MLFFDLHCDTAGECFKAGTRLFSNNMQLDLVRGKCFSKWTQTFAIWVNDDLRGEDAYRYAVNGLDFLKEELKSDAPDNLIPIFAVEGGAALAGKIEHLDTLREKCVSLMTLTWNGENEIASGAYAEGGLKPFGKAVVKAMEDFDMTVDISHLNRQSFFDVAKVITKPIIATHSNADIVETEAGHKRNLTKEQIAIIRDCGGIIGLNLYESFLEDAKAQGIDAVCRQIDYFLSLNCENTLAFGSDFDGCTINSEFDRIEKIPNLYDELLKKGYSETILNRIFYENAACFFKKKNTASN